MSTHPAVRVLTGLVALITSVSLATAASAASKPPRSQPSYVALGDSYAAGTGAGSYLSDGTQCHRSLLGYPGLIAKASGYALNLQACSGATVADVSSLQLGALTSSTAKVSITVGGNDIGFAPTLSTCLGSDTTACLAAVAAANDQIANVLPAKLDGLFTQVRAKAPTARIVVTGYPRLFNGTNCSLFTSFTASEMTALNAGDDSLTAAIAAAAGRAGFGFVDVRTPFVGHAVCDSTPWIKNVSVFTQWESFHPNGNGYLYGYKPSVSTSLSATATSASGSMTVTVGGQTSSDTSRGTVRAGA